MYSIIHLFALYYKITLFTSPIKFNKISNLIIFKMIKQQTIDLNLYLPKFYPKEEQISHKLNPLLKKVRENHIANFHQFQSIQFKNQQNHSPSIQLKNDRRQPFRNTYNKSPLKLNRQSPQISIYDTQKNSIQLHKHNNSHKNKKFNIEQISKNYPQFICSGNQISAQLPTGPNHIKNKSFSYNIRSKTSNKMKKKNYSTIVPKTADFSNNNLNVDMQTLNKLDMNLNNPQSMFINIDEEMFNYIRFKMLTKTPYFTGGKQAKFKKHLIEQIDFKQIEKKFYRTPSNMTKYQKFFQDILIKKQKALLQPKKTVTMFNKNQNNKFFIKENNLKLKNQDKKDTDLLYDFSKSNHNNSQQIQSKKSIKQSESLSLKTSQNQFNFNQKCLKTSFKARSWAKKRLLKHQNDNNSKQWFKAYSPQKSTQNQLNIEIKGSKKSLTPDKSKVISSFS